ncbi:MAG TPA: response regulator [Holophaga sp.]|nr:response regulator [Holophaga sp.]
MGGERLLVVDDDPVIAAMLRRILVKAGHDVAVAGDARTAREALEGEGPFHAVLLDRQLPDEDGLQVLEALKASPATREIPVVLQTSMGSQAEISEGLKRGAFYYLVKPLDPLMVVQVVGAALAQAADRKAFFRAMEGALSAVSALSRGRFAYRTLGECHDLAALLAHACPDPRRSGVGLSELMINALEHGNLGITYAEKTRLLDARGWVQEVERRLALPGLADRRVTVSVARSARVLRFRVTDMGEGFDWREYQEIRPSRLFDNHGRGIVLARYEAFDRIRYEGRGNIVVAEIDLA